MTFCFYKMVAKLLAHRLQLFGFCGFQAILSSTHLSCPFLCIKLGETKDAFGNALLYGLPKYQIQRLQSVQNCAARLIKRLSKFDHISPLRFEFHWFPVEHRIVFKSVFTGF